ncbi:MAG: uridine kinase [Gemmatimonadetes bacterium]|nr:uridine kinase [Gemmatimonadota bacterium]|tara:strand:+ start:722 stop:1333 length:612 start_codon:yes stop_codon:yes gene_type:complete
MTYTIGIAGGTGAGKTRLARALLKRFDHAVLLAHDAYYRDLTGLSEKERAGVNFDAPESLDTELLAEHLDRLGAGKPVAVPVYDFSTHTRTTETRTAFPAPVVIVEGILLLESEAICERLKLKVFVEADADERVLRRIQRDVDERGRSVASVMEQYLATVKPMHDRYVEPCRAKADLVVNGRRDTSRAVDVIVAHVQASGRSS